ncbi:MAG TPA: hypothetical protein VM912_04995 [Terriglobales bacterium]|nr:hypothetical protein [Terriglobales bacterium]
MFFGIYGINRGTLLGATLLMCGVAPIASYFPARRATHIDPIVSTSDTSEPCRLGRHEE